MGKRVGNGRAVDDDLYCTLHVHGKAFGILGTD
jgi:hypothetical protein